VVGSEQPASGSGQVGLLDLFSLMAAVQVISGATVVLGQAHIGVRAARILAYSAATVAGIPLCILLLILIYRVHAAFGRFVVARQQILSGRALAGVCVAYYAAVLASGALWMLIGMRLTTMTLALFFGGDR
jgi:hypothetical protein